MKLDILVKAITPVFVQGALERDITAIAYDSRHVTEGSLFVALPGEKADGNAYIDAAIDRGAVAIVSRR